jgi:hypothetical protein
MNRHTRCGALALVITVCGAASASGLSRDARITTGGLGPVTIGMTERQVERAAKRSVTRRGDRGECSVARIGDKVEGLFTGSRLARIYVGTRRYATRSGVRIGDSEKKVLSVYAGDVVREPHKYVRGGWYLKVVSGNRKVVFETEDDRVKSISTGRTPEIDYVEGCS